MEPIRTEVSSLIGVKIPAGKWQQTFDQLLPKGYIGPKQQIELLLMLLQHVEALENGSKEVNSANK